MFGDGRRLVLDLAVLAERHARRYQCAAAGAAALFDQGRADVPFVNSVLLGGEGFQPLGYHLLQDTCCFLFQHPCLIQVLVSKLALIIGEVAFCRLPFIRTHAWPLLIFGRV